MRKLSILGIVASATVGAAVLGATAQDIAQRSSDWPAIKGPPVVNEWYSDIPWRQKLGTFSGNELDVAIMLPYDALPDTEKAFCAAKHMSQEDCMIELGVVNVLGTRRIDTLYDPDDPKLSQANAPECKKDSTQPCIEVLLELSSFWTRVSTSQVAGGEIALVARKFGKEPPVTDGGIQTYGGHVITDGSTYAPQMPWYMSHYCQSKFPGNADTQDPVCYADYLSPMNNGFSPLNEPPPSWPRNGPWSVMNGTRFPAPTNHCPPGAPPCTIALAAFKLTPVSSDLAKIQYSKENNFLFSWFNNALAAFKTDVSDKELKHHYPWSGDPVKWEDVHAQALANPFQGEFTQTPPGPPEPLGSNCQLTFTGPVPSNPGGCTNTGNIRASTYLYPRQCTLAHLASGNVNALRECSLNFELHPNGFEDQWPRSWWSDLNGYGFFNNQYGRTSFVFAGVPGMQLPTSFLRKDTATDSLSYYEQVHNASIFSLYMPIANVADTKNAFGGRNYSDTEFYHTLLMSNHMEAEPELFTDGIRGKVLWHNEYRTQHMYLMSTIPQYANRFPTKSFAGSFDAKTAKAPFHNNTCDACHLRNGSGVPINPQDTLDEKLWGSMTNGKYNPRYAPDYTFTGEVRPMKLVFFDLARDTTRLDSSRYSEPLSFSAGVVADPPRTMTASDLYYNNKVMNFYGDSFHVKLDGKAEDTQTYKWKYVPVEVGRLVVNVSRKNPELTAPYELWQVSVGSFEVPSTCVLVPPPSPPPKEWPRSCTEVNATAISDTIKDNKIGYMLLNGKRLGNLSAMEAIPNKAILGFRESQKTLLGEAIAGEIIWNAGSRDGVKGKVWRKCRTKRIDDCFIGRFGWIGDRVSLEDQVANAAFVEMNMTTSEGYKALYFKDNEPFPIRYNHPNCGPANKTCVDSGGNGDLTEIDVGRMADYARWVGNPTRSELKVTLPEVVAGERKFKELKCDTCHVIKRINITTERDPIADDTMVTKAYRERLATHAKQTNNPFLSYIGTDLLMHDMGYLSLVGNAGQEIRDSNGVVLPAYKNYVQKIRTPALKGLRFNRFVTDSHRNAKAGEAACDFLLHDGRACDALEAAFLHDGPAVRKLGMIGALNDMTPTEASQLRAFLYSL